MKWEYRDKPCGEKMTNKVKFTPDEQQYLVDKLDIRTMKEFRDIFFSNEVEEK